MRILVVEDERKVASFIRQGLEEEGYAVDVVGDGAAALERLIEGPSTDLVVLGIGLAKLGGLGGLQARRRSNQPTMPRCFAAEGAVSLSRRHGSQRTQRCEGTSPAV